MTEPMPALSCPPFDPRRFRRRLAVDQAIRGTMFAIVLAVVMWAVVLGGAAVGPMRLIGLAWDPYVVMALVLVPWIAVNLIGAKALHLAKQAEQYIDHHALAEGETLLAPALRRWPVSRRVHLVLHRHLAELRHHQKRYDQTLAICRELLWALSPRRRGANTRTELLLMLVESALECRSLVDAYHGLAALHGQPLKLEQRLARMLLQTHYEVLIGADSAALHAWDRKVELAELLPQPLCGVMHAFLAAAAERAQMTDAAAWLTARAKLLAPRQARYVFKLVGLRPSTADTSGLAGADR